MKAVILARVSTSRQEQEGLSLKEMQLPALRNYSASKGLEIDKEFVFSESADQKIRTKFNEMVEYIKNNEEIGCIIAYRVDRITRNFRDAVLVNDLMHEYDIELHFVEDRLIINKDTVGTSITNWDTKVFLGKQYLNRLREDGINSLNHKLEQGELPTRAPFGYRNVTVGKKKTVELDGIDAQIVKFAFESYATGTMSMEQIREKIQTDYGRKITRGQVDKILKNKFYYGVMSIKDRNQDYPHKYETLISKDLYDKVQEIKEGYGKKTGHKYAGLPYPYRGLITCAECGCSLSPEKKKGKYVYYKCTEYKGKHGAKYIREEEITKQLTSAFKSIKIPQVIVDEISQTLKESHEDKVQFHRDMLNEYRREYDKYETRIERMYEDKLDGLISTEEYLSRVQGYKEKQRLYKSKMEQLEDANDSYYTAAESLLNLANRVGELFESSELEQKRLFIKLTLQNLKLNGDKLVYDWIRPFDSFAEHASCQRWQGIRDSNP